jgi:hypothetical protein
MPHIHWNRAVGATRLAPIALVASLLALALVVFGAPESDDALAAPTKKSAYIAVTGEGSTARGWYDGASPPGVSLQEALSKYSEEGYRIVCVTEPHIAISTAGQIWYILLEKD